MKKMIDVRKLRMKLKKRVVLKWEELIEIRRNYINLRVLYYKKESKKLNKMRGEER